MAAAVAALIGGVPAVAANPAGGALGAADQAVLDRFRSDYTKSLVEAAPDRAIAPAADDVRLMPAYQWPVLGKNNAATYYAAFLKRFRVREFRREAGGAADLGGGIGEYGTFEQTLIRRDTGAEHAIRGKYLDLWMRQPDGSVRLVAQVWNYEGQLPFGDDLRFADVPAVVTAYRARVLVKAGISFELAALDEFHGVVITQHDAGRWSLFFADDAVLMPNYATTRRGRAEIDEFIQAHTRELPIFEKLDIRNDRIDDLGRYVIEYASHVANWRNGDSSGVNTGKDLRIWRREAGGGLRLFWQIGNYD